MTFRRYLSILLIVVVFVNFLSGCAEYDNKSITCSDVISAYEDAGYEIFHHDRAEEDGDWICYVIATDTKSDESVYFHFFDSSDAAQEYADTQKWNVILWLYSVACFDPVWITTKTYGNIEYQYMDNDIARPFEELID